MICCLIRIFPAAQYMALISRRDWTVQRSIRFTPIVATLHPSGTVSFVRQLTFDREFFPKVV